MPRSACPGGNVNDHTIARLADLSLPVQNKFKSADVILSAQGITAEITQGLRSWNEQSADYAIGREPVDTVNELRKAVGLAPLTDAGNREPVTWAEPGESWHQYGMAFDAVPFVAGVPCWNVGNPKFARMVAVFRSVGLACGIDWPGQKKDSDHFQDAGKFPVSPDAEVIQLFKAGGTVSVWAEAYAVS